MGDMGDMGDVDGWIVFFNLKWYIVLLYVFSRSCDFLDDGWYLLHLDRFHLESHMGKFRSIFQVGAKDGRTIVTPLQHTSA